jgi:hypothetical protein
MRDILDPANIWTGIPGRAVVVFGNKAPVTQDDTLVVTVDSPPVTVDVLNNDLDPEGQPLTLVSASAALGTAIAETDHTVTYTPPSGISGADTIVYVIADDLGQTQSGQVNVTIAEPQLSIQLESDNTLSVDAATGLLEFTVTTPPEFAGTWQIDTAGLMGGPINLVPPAITGTFAENEVLSASDGLWIYDVAAGLPAQSWQWRRAGTDIAGATSASYTVSGADIGQGLSVVERLTDTFGQRDAVSATQSADFQPSDDASVIGWWDADEPTSLTVSGTAVSVWASKVGSNDLAQAIVTDQPETGTRTLNGRNVLDFGGTRHLFGAVTLPASGDVAFHMALEIDATNNAFEALLATEATSHDFQIDAQSATQFDGRLNAIDLGGNATSLSGGPFSGALIVSVVFDLSGAGTAQAYISNIERGTMTYQTALNAAPSLHVMTNRSRNAWVDGAVAELIVTGDVSNRALYHSYLAAKWGLI